MLFEQRGEYESQWAAVVSIAAKIGGTPQTMSNWVRQHERDTGQREGAYHSRGPARQGLERQVCEWRFANCAAPTKS